MARGKAEVDSHFKMADTSMEGIDLYADVDDFVRVSIHICVLNFEL